MTGGIIRFLVVLPAHQARWDEIIPKNLGPKSVKATTRHDYDSPCAQAGSDHASSLLTLMPSLTRAKQRKWRVRETELVGWVAAKASEQDKGQSEGGQTTERERGKEEEPYKLDQEEHIRHREQTASTRSNKNRLQASENSTVDESKT